MVSGRTALGGDFDAGAAGAGESRGIGVLIDFHFLDRRSGDAWAVRFDAVDDKRHAAGGDGVVAEETREQGDVIEIEDGNAVESVTRDAVGI